MYIKLPGYVESALNTLAKNGYEAYVVGGCVRDSLMGRQPEDWDICTEALPEEASACFCEYTVIETGLKHGTVSVVCDDAQLEITTFRKDGVYSDFRHPENVDYIKNLGEDLSRRDFTINAMAYSPKSGLIDCFGGMTDLKNKLVRCVGNAEQRFQEDALRILRALRFASVFDFQIFEETSKAILTKKELLAAISAERISAELSKIICGIGSERILRKYFDVVAVFIPELKSLKNFGAWELTLKELAAIRPDIRLRLVMLLGYITVPDCRISPVRGSAVAVEILRRLRYDNDTIETVRDLILYCQSDIKPTGPCIKRWLNKIGEAKFRQLLDIKRARLRNDGQEHLNNLSNINKIGRLLEEILRTGQCYSLARLNINGNHLLDIGIKEGKLIGAVLDMLLEMVIAGEIRNDRDALIKRARDCVKDNIAPTTEK